jgi:hypothetical protein
MRYFTLKTFEPMNPDAITGLILTGETRINAETAEEGKRKLSDWIDGRVLERERFYRFEGYVPSRGVRPQFVLNISFYLFEDGRLCPLRIWHWSEQTSNQSGQADWMVDFNGIPGWSLVASIEPRWYTTPRDTVPSVAGNPWSGRSHRDWYKRTCWTLTPPYLESCAGAPLKVAC